MSVNPATRCTDEGAAARAIRAVLYRAGIRVRSQSDYSNGGFVAEHKGIGLLRYGQCPLPLLL
jgi:hypothetical protein